MWMPYQCLQKCGDILVAASGSCIDSLSLDDNGSILSCWKCPTTNESKKTEAISQNACSKLIIQTSGTSSEDVVSGSSPPAKRRKLSGAEDVGDNSTDQSGKKNINNRSSAVGSGLDAPAIVALNATKDGQHVVAVTGDKSIRVFQRDGAGNLRQISQRVMPKRPCALIITDDDSTIISADKFGDVYSLPLFLSEAVSDPLVSSNDSRFTTQVLETASTKHFVPAANDLTVHSVRNRKALENQLRQTNKPSEKTEPTFEHKLLLGHVSMLTDIALGHLEGRDYIITADRDEHIRVSRGIPNSHIIESFCLGHTDFISRLCIPRERPDLLISGGGEDGLFVWEWALGTLVSKADLRGYFDGLMAMLSSTSEYERPQEAKVTEPRKFAVLGICHTRITVQDSKNDLIIVTCEGLPALVIFSLTDQRCLVHLETISLRGNALSVVVDNKSTGTCVSHVLVSIDNIHKPGSIQEPRDDKGGLPPRLQKFAVTDHGLVESPLVFGPLQDEVTVVGIEMDDCLTNLLYNLENLRKRDGGVQDEE